MTWEKTVTCLGGARVPVGYPCRKSFKITDKDVIRRDIRVKPDEDKQITYGFICKNCGTFTELIDVPDSVKENCIKMQM